MSPCLPATPEQVKWFANQGAVAYTNSLSELGERAWPWQNNDWAGDIVHFFDKDGLEIGYVSVVNRDHPMVFDPPRRWDSSIKEKYHVRDLILDEDSSVQPEDQPTTQETT